MRFRLRTLLIVLALGPPFIAGVVQYRNWRELQIWRSLERAKVKRDGLLQAWRANYERLQSGQASAAAEDTALRQQYFDARRDVEKTRTAIEARYGSFEKGLQAATQTARDESTMFRFTIRGGLWLAVVMGAVFGWIRCQAKRQSQQKAAHQKAKSETLHAIEREMQPVLCEKREQANELDLPLPYPPPA